MNITDALKSGDQFQQVGDERWYSNFNDWIGGFLDRLDTLDVENKGFLHKALLADNFEIQEVKVEVTLASLRNAFSSVIDDENDDAEIFAQVAANLGLINGK